MRVGVFLAGAIVLLSACGGISGEPLPEDDVGVAAPGDASPTSTALPSEMSGTTRSPVPSVADVDLVGYVAVIEHMLEGTTYEGTALASPDIFLATGALFCSQLDGGITSGEVLGRYLESLTGGAPDDASDDDLTMAGAVLGSGLATLCPHHIATIGATE
ncbi:MAG: hypothetical protein GY720_20475 [bacterium]|nr:hypothetical protein [bacterium]